MVVCTRTESVHCCSVKGSLLEENQLVSYCLRQVEAGSAQENQLMFHSAREVVCEENLLSREVVCEENLLGACRTHCHVGSA